MTGLGPWQSERLIYRAIEPEDEHVLLSISSDPEAFSNSAPFLPQPRSKKSATQHREWLEGALISAMMCLPPPTTGPQDDTAMKPIPVGLIHLHGSDARLAHHRHGDIGINVLKPYQGQGYGTEAMKWVLHWGFQYAGLHRIELGAFEYNPGAVKLYERIGFVPEGKRRDWMWFNGRYWDVHMFSMLEHEWRERFGEKQNSSI